MLADEFKKLCARIPEIQLYYLIDLVGGAQWALQHEMADGRMEESEENQQALAKLQEQVQYAVSQTTRFDVSTPMDEENRPTDDYWAWFNWWNTYMKALPPEVDYQLAGIFQAIDERITGQSDIALDDLVERLKEYRPEGNWRVAA